MESAWRECLRVMSALPYILRVVIQVECFALQPGDVLLVHPGTAEPIVAHGRDGSWRSLPPNYGVIAGALADDRIVMISPRLPPSLAALALRRHVPPRDRRSAGGASPRGPLSLLP